MHYFIYINNNALLSYYSIILTIVTNSNFKNMVKTLKDKIKSKKIKQKNFVGKKKKECIFNSQRLQIAYIISNKNERIFMLKYAEAKSSRNC